MSPILIRPVREQIEHDRIIRVLHARLKGEYEVESNLGDDRRATLRIGPRTHFPDIVLTAAGAPKKVLGVIEVETGESVNHLEAMAQWAHFGKARAAFYLYVPVSGVDIAKRLIDDYKISVTELWSYAPAGDRVHFWLVQASSASTTPAGTEFSVPVDGGHLAPRPYDTEPEPEKPAEPPAVPAARPEKAAKGAKVPPAPVKKPAEKAAKPAAPEPKAPVKTPAKPVTKPVPAAPPPRPAPKPSAKPVRKAPAPKPAKPAKPVKPVKKAVAPSRTSKAPKAAKKAPPKPVKSKPAAKKATVKAKGPAKKSAAKRAVPAKKRR